MTRMSLRTCIVAIFLISVSLTIKAQIPYFASTAGDGKLYGYTSLKFRPGLNAQETYTTFQYGLGDYTAAGLDLYTAEGSGYLGVLFRAGKMLNSRFGIGGQVTPSFEVDNKMKFSYITTALYLNGALSEDGKLFWCSNTWWRVKKGLKDLMTNWEYLGYAVSLKNGHTFTPMAGLIHSWRFDQDVDVAAGFYYSINKFNFYLWGNDFLKSHPRVVIGLDFKL